MTPEIDNNDNAELDSDFNADYPRSFGQTLKCAFVTETESLQTAPLRCNTDVFRLYISWRICPDLASLKNIYCVPATNRHFGLKRKKPVVGLDRLLFALFTISRWPAKNTPVTDNPTLPVLTHRTVINLHWVRLKFQSPRTMTVTTTLLVSFNRQFRWNLDNSAGVPTEELRRFTESKCPNEKLSI